MPSVPAIRQGVELQLGNLGSAIAYSKAAPTTNYNWPGSWPVVREPFTGAWQRNMEEATDTLLTQHAVYACITLIASDIAKCRLKLVEQDSDGIWSETKNTAHSPLLTKPNEHQNRIQFFESWMTSKLIDGNTYVLKSRDQRKVVNALYVLDPARTKPKVTPRGDVYYELSRDNMARVEDTLEVPASEIIHDMTTLRYHPLCGVPPLAPAALAASQGLNIQRTSVDLFRNGATPGGFLKAPGEIPDDQIDRIRTEWHQKFGGSNAGRLAILHSGMEYQPGAQTAVEAQLMEQIGLSARMVCSAFNVPSYMVLGDPPSYNNIEALNQLYYSQCLQKHFEAIELCLDEGLGLDEIEGKTLGVEFDLDDLLRMDTATQIKTYGEGVRGMILASNEARKKLGYKPKAGGDVPFGQHQQYPIDMLANRDRPLPGDSGSVPRDEQPADNDNAGEDQEEELAAARAMYSWRANDKAASIADRILALAA